MLSQSTWTDGEEYYKLWLEQDVAYIITSEEKEVFLNLTTNDEKTKFIELFWLRRDPDPSTFPNELKEEHYRRIAHVNTYFGSGIPGWKTDRGRIYIIHGPPAEVESHSSGGSYDRPRHEGGGRTSTFPFEVWRYHYIEDIGSDVEIEFVDKTLTGQFSLALDASEKDALLRIPGAGLTLLEETGAASKTDRVIGVNQQEAFLQMGRRFRDLPFERLIQNSNLNRPPPIQFKDLQRLVTAKVIYRDLPIRVIWDHLWIDDERVLVPVTVSFPASALSYRAQGGISSKQASVQFYGRITSISGGIVSEFERKMSFAPSHPNSGLLLQHQVLLSPGRYRLEVVLKDLVGKKFGTDAVGLVIPTNLTDRLKIGSLMLARKIELVSSAESVLVPYVYGDLRVIPSPNPDFQNTSKLGLYFHVVGPNLKADGPVPVELLYQILQDGNVVEEIRDSEGITVHRQSDGRIVAFVFLSLRKLAVGSYTVRVICQEWDGTTTSASREVRII